MEIDVRTLINQEDRRRPLTDDELAARLGLRRDQVTILRQQSGTPDSRERRRQAVIEAIGRLPDPTVSDRELTRLLQEQGFDVSRQVASQCRQEAARLREAAAPPAAPAPAPVPARHARQRPAPAMAPPIGSFQRATVPNPSTERAFERLVGATGSLKPVIEQVRAAVLYPPHGLHTLILGPTGVGKSEMAKAMFEFARESGRMAPGARFVAFNCADYAENPQLLVSQLFGVAKGAYTGANAEKTGLVEQAHGGMLFLDEVHRLPPDGQEILYYLIDHGAFRRLGESDSIRKVQVMIVAATTEDVDSTLLLPFRRRIPMVVRLPALAERPLAERLVYVEATLAEEATRIGMPIRATVDAVKALLLYDCPGNLGGLRSDIQVSCARSFVASVTSKGGGLTVGLGELPPHVTRGLLRTEGRRHELGNLVLGDLHMMPGVRPVRHLVKDEYAMPLDVYEYVERHHEELAVRGVSGPELQRRLGSALESRLQAFVRRVQTGPLTTAQKELTGLVGPQVVEAATRMVEVARAQMETVDDRLLYCLATHLSAALERIRQGRHLTGAPVPPVQVYARELAIAKQMVAGAEQVLGLELPTEEVTYVALYLHSFSESGEREPRVGVVILSHGRVASAMAEVANRLLGVSHARAVEMSLDERPEAALERARQAVVEADEGRGVLLLADMGSLVTFGPMITENTRVPTRTVERVDTAVALDAVRRAMLPGATLDEVAAALPGLKAQAPAHDPNRPRAVLAVCITGQGAALKIRDLVQQTLPTIPVLTDGLVTPDTLHDLTTHYDLLAAVGTVDPGIPGVPFIPFQEMLHGAGSARLRLLAGHTAPVRPEPLRLRDVLDPALLLPQLSAANKEQVLRLLADLLAQQGYVRTDFLDGVMEREEMGPAVLGQSIAIPHADPTRVRRPGIAVAVLERPIPWGEGLQVDVVCMAALTAESGSLVLELNTLAGQPQRMALLRQAYTKQALLEALTR